MFLLVIGLLLLLSAGIGGFFLGKKQAQTENLAKITPTIHITPAEIPVLPTKVFTPTPTIDLNIKPKVLTINKTNPAGPKYSFKYPKPTFCQGCYDGLSGGPETYQSGEIVNQAKSYGQPESEDWIIQNTTFKIGTKTIADWSIINENFFNEIGTLNINSSTNLTDRSDSSKTYMVTRLNDRTIDGVNARIFSSNWSNGIKGGKTYYAVFQKDNFQYLISVMWADPKNNYIFDLVTSSFLFSLRPESEATYN